MTKQPKPAVTVKVTRDNCITIPISIRRKLGMRAGDIFDILGKGGKICVVPVKPRKFRKPGFAEIQIVKAGTDF